MGIKSLRMSDRKAVIKNADVRGDAAGCCRLCHAGSGEVQHLEGHCGLHQEGVRQEVQPHVALYRGQELWLLRHARDQALHLLLPRPGRHSSLQERLKIVDQVQMEQLYFWKPRLCPVETIFI